MRILYGLTRPDAGAIEVDGRPVTIGSPRDAIAAGIGMVTQHFSLVAADDRRGERRARAVERHPARPRRRPAPRPRRRRHVRGRGRSRRAHRGPLGRGAAARRDRQGARARLPRPHPRRADGGARPAGGGGPVRVAASSRRRRARGRVHQPQARRGARDLRPRQRAPRRGPRRERAGRHRRAGAGADDGRTADLRGRAGRPGGADGGAEPPLLRVEGLVAPDTTACLRCQGSTSAWPQAESLGVAGVSGNGQSELVGHSRACAGRRRGGCSSARST